MCQNDPVETDPHEGTLYRFHILVLDYDAKTMHICSG